VGTDAFLDVDDSLAIPLIPQQDTHDSTEANITYVLSLYSLAVFPALSWMLIAVLDGEIHSLALCLLDCCVEGT